LARSTAYFKRSPNVAYLVIDHSVGKAGRNLPADVQLVQIMLNRVFRLERDKMLYWLQECLRDQKPITLDLRAMAQRELPTDKTGRMIQPLGVDGVCGQRTIAAILAFQQSVKRTNGAAGPVDGTINAIGIPGSDEYAMNKHHASFMATDKDGHPIRKWLDDDRFYAMYLLCVRSSERGKPLGLSDISAEPLKSSLMRSTKA
jgi:hypothetical protein